MTELKEELNKQFKFFIENSNNMFKIIKDFKLQLTNMNTKFNIDGASIIAQMSNKETDTIKYEALQRAKKIGNMEAYKIKVNKKY